MNQNPKIEYVVTTVDADRVIGYLSSLLDLAGIYLWVIGLWIVIRKTPLILHLWERLVHKEPAILPDFEDWLAVRSQFLHTLWLCKWCQGFWLSCLLVGLAVFHGLLAGWTTPLWIPAVYPLVMVPVTCFWKQ